MPIIALESTQGKQIANNLGLGDATKASGMPLTAIQPTYRKRDNRVASEQAKVFLVKVAMVPARYGCQTIRIPIPLVQS